MKATRGRLAAALGLTVAVLAPVQMWSAAPVGAHLPGLNGKLACVSFRDDGLSAEIYTFEASGTEVGATRLTNTPGISEGRPRYSPDGREIVFEKSGNLWIMNADGTGARQLTFTTGNGGGSWSPGGDQIAYQTSRYGTGFEVQKINVDGTGDTRLTNNAVEDSLPAWSPKGDKIAFSSRQVDSAANVHLMNPDGTNVVNLPGNVVGTEDSWPSWSPDGSMIAFHSRRDDADGEEIYRMNADGTNVVRLTFNAGVVASGSFDIFPVWSPDGTRIAWNSGRGGELFGEIYTMRATDGADIVRITNNPAVEQRCDWQPVCTIYGSGTIVGTPGDDVICGSPGNDLIAAGGGKDRVLGLGGNDRMGGEGGDDGLFGGFGADTIDGGPGTDITDGGLGTPDRCVGEQVQNCP